MVHHTSIAISSCPPEFLLPQQFGQSIIVRLKKNSSTSLLSSSQSQWFCQPGVSVMCEDVYVEYPSVLWHFAQPYSRISTLSSILGVAQKPVHQFSGRETASLALPSTTFVCEGGIYRLIPSLTRPHPDV